MSRRTDVLAPALRRRRERFARTADGVAAEHLLSACTSAALSTVIWRRRGWTRVPPVLLAAPEGERHVLPLHALAAAHTPSVARRADLALLRRRPVPEPSTLVLGGPGWPPGSAGRVDDLAAAVHACTSPTLPVLRGSGIRPGLAS